MKYIGFKMVDAVEMKLGEYNTFRGWNIPDQEDPEKEGYKIVYRDGYQSWCPKDVFEKSNMQVSYNNTITQKNVDEFIQTIEATKLDEKTTLVKVTLVNGFVIVESSSCVDSANFDMQIGVDICLKKVKDKIWYLLGFLLQTAMNGTTMIEKKRNDI